MISFQGVCDFLKWQCRVWEIRKCCCVPLKALFSITILTLLTNSVRSQQWALQRKYAKRTCPSSRILCSLLCIAIWSDMYRKPLYLSKFLKHQRGKRSWIQCIMVKILSIQYHDIHFDDEKSSLMMDIRSNMFIFQTLYVTLKIDI